MNGRMFIRAISILACCVVFEATASPVDDLPMPQPIPTNGAVPPVVAPELLEAINDMRLAAEYGPYQRRIRTIVRTGLGRMRDQDKRQAALDALRRFTDSGALFSMPFVLAAEAEDVRTVMLRHLSESGSVGQAALAWAAIHHDDADMRSAAAQAITAGDEPLVLAAIETGLRDNRHAIVTRAGTLAGMVDAVQAIPLMIFSQYSRDPIEKKGDLAWIAIGTQRSYVQNLIPTTGNGAGAFQPVIGTITEGFVMRVMDAYAVVYRTELRRNLVQLSTRASGASTEHLGWDLDAWRDWYNEDYLAVVASGIEEAKIERSADDIVRREKSRADEKKIGRRNKDQ